MIKNCYIIKYVTDIVFHYGGHALINLLNKVSCSYSRKTGMLGSHSSLCQVVGFESYQSNQTII